MGLPHVIQNHNPTLPQRLTVFKWLHCLTYLSGNGLIKDALCWLLMEVLPDEIHVDISVLAEDSLQVQPDGVHSILVVLFIPGIGRQIALLNKDTHRSPSGPFELSWHHQYQPRIVTCLPLHPTINHTTWQTSSWLHPLTLLCCQLPPALNLVNLLSMLILPVPYHLQMASHWDTSLCVTLSHDRWRWLWLWFFEVLVSNKLYIMGTEVKQMQAITTKRLLPSSVRANYELITAAVEGWNQWVGWSSGLWQHGTPSSCSLNWSINVSIANLRICGSIN